MQIKLAPDLSLFAIIAIFILNYLVVRRFFLQPVAQVLDERERDTRTADELYEQSLARYNEETSRIETQLHAAKRQAAEIRERHRAEAAKHRAGVIQRTHDEATQLVSDADAHLSRDVTEARERIARESESLARLAAERILGRPV